jgi:hypothetical protein
MNQNISIRVVFAMVSMAALSATVGCNGLVIGADDYDSKFNSNFDSETIGIPKGWTAAETSTAGTPADWAVEADSSAVGKPNVVTLSKNNNHGGTFNLLLAEKTKYKDLEISVKVKAVSGREDQGGGPVWRAIDADNYYVCRWNPLEDNFRLYVVKDGRRRQLASAKVIADRNAWHEIEIEHEGSKITAEFDDKKLIEFKDDTFKEAGMVGLWTKADAVTKFYDIKVEAEDEDESDDD